MPYLAAYGLVLALFNALWTLSVVLNGAAVATVLVYCSGAFTSLLGRLILKERLGWAKIVAVAMILAGVIFMRIYEERTAWRSGISPIHY